MKDVCPNQGTQSWNNRRDMLSELFISELYPVFHSFSKIHYIEFGIVPHFFETDHVSLILLS